MMAQIDIDKETLDRLEGASYPEKIGIYGKMMGPAWLGVALNIGGASFVTGAVLGAATGVQFLWVIVLAIIGSWIMMMGAMKLMLAHPKPLMQMIRDQIHPAVAWGIAIATLLVTLIFHSVQLVLSASWLQTLFGASFELWIVATIALIALITLPGRTQRFQKYFEDLMKIVVSLMVIALVINLFYIDVDWGAVTTGLVVPTIPTEPDTVLLVTGVIGAGFVLNVPIIMTYGVRAREWGSDFMNFGRWEVHISQGGFLLANLVIVIVFAFTLGTEGIVPGSPIEATAAVEPLVGDFAWALLGFGLWAAVVSTAMVHVAIFGYVVSDIMEWEINPAAKTWKASGACVFLVGGFVPLIGVSPFEWTAIGSAFNVSFTFLFIIVLIYLLRSQDVMGEHRISGRLYWGLIYSLLTAVIVVGNFYYSQFFA